MAAKARTRNKSGSKFSDFVGGSRPLLPSELPTERACLRAGLELQRIKVVEEGLDKGEYKVPGVLPWPQRQDKVHAVLRRDWTILQARV